VARKKMKEEERCMMAATMATAGESGCNQRKEEERDFFNLKNVSVNHTQSAR